MNKYLATIHLHELDEDFWQLIPEHRERISKLLADEVIETYGVNLERTKGWIVINADKEAEAEAIIESFPIRDYFSFEMDQLFLFENALALLPKMVLN